MDIKNLFMVSFKIHRHYKIIYRYHGVILIYPILITIILALKNNIFSFYEKFFSSRKHEILKAQNLICPFFVFSSFRAFVINFFFGSPINRDLRFTPTASTW